jgi:D-glycero-D-manno-heptose 1,7-bisphosphate phosphatase
MNKAIFVDRDGVLNKLVFNRKARMYGAPLCPKDLKIFSQSHKVLKKFQELGYLLFLVSNQPDYAKGYTSLKDLKAVQARLRRYFVAKGIKFSGYFYCLHHPQAVVIKYKLNCPCRKPGPYFLLKAKHKYGLDMKGSWFIGDSDSDVFCGKRAGVNTILIEQRYSRHKRGASKPDFFATDLKGALKIISDTKKGR